VFEQLTEWGVMGFMQRAVAKTELRTVGMIEDALASETFLDHGRMTVPCHIVHEMHTGVWVGRHEDSRWWVGVFRCQNHFWGQRLQRNQVEGARRGEDQSLHILMMRMGGDLPPLDLGLMADGTKALAQGLDRLDYGIGRGFTL
jgi:hypothetical protein